LELESELELRLVDFEGSKFYTYYNRRQCFYYCPVCGTEEGNPIFFKLQDLISHMRTHVKAIRQKSKESRVESE